MSAKREFFRALTAEVDHAVCKRLAVDAERVDEAVSSVGIQLTVQGGAQALLAELAAAHALGAGEPLVATDLDIRFLDRLYVGPLAARAIEVEGHDGVPRAHVTLFDAGKDDRLVSAVTVSMTRPS